MYYEFVERLAKAAKNGSKLVTIEQFKERALVLFMIGIITQEEYQNVLEIVS